MLRTAVLLGTVAACLGAQVPALLVEWQGCPDCTKYGDGLVSKGLDHGLGPLMNLTVMYIKGHHPGVFADPDFAPFAACAQYVNATDVNYRWYGVLACANPGKTIADCETQTGFNPTESAMIKHCMSDKTLADGLVEKMNTAASKYNDYPWAIVNGQTMPEPDTHNDNIDPFIEAVCKGAAPTTAPACKKYN